MRSIKWAKILDFDMWNFYDPRQNAINFRKVNHENNNNKRSDGAA